MSKKKERRQKEYQKSLTSCILMGIIVICVGLLIANINFNEPNINELTTSFISFNNKNTTDMLKVTNIEKMSDKRGNSRWNPHSLTINITGEKNQSYEIVLYPLTNPIEDNYIRYVVKIGKEETKDHLLNPESTDDGGKIIYRGTIHNRKTTIRLWIADEYRGKVTQNAFEIKIRPR